MATDKITGPTLTVQGEGRVAAQPDEARLWLRLTHVADTQENAMREVARRSEELGRALDELGVESADRSSQSLSVQEATEWRRDERVHLGFRASTRVRLRLGDLEVIGRLVSAAASRAEAAVSQLDWRVTDERALRREAYRLAAEDARLTAEACAEGLGVRLGPVEHVSEAGAPVRYSNIGPPDLGRERATAAKREDPVLDLQPGERDIAAGVEVTFRLISRQV